MSYYIRIDTKEDIDWLAQLISNSLNKGPNDPFLQMHYERISAWNSALSLAIPSKSALSSTDLPSELLSTQDAKTLEQITAPQPKRRGRPPGKKASPKKTSKSTKSKSVEVNDPYSCTNHATYSGSRAPRTDCEKCWSVYKLLNPMTYAQARSRFNLKQKKKSLS